MISITTKTPNGKQHTVHLDDKDKSAPKELTIVLGDDDTDTDVDTVPLDQVHLQDGETVGLCFVRSEGSQLTCSVIDPQSPTAGIGEGDLITVDTKLMPTVGDLAVYPSDQEQFLLGVIRIAPRVQPFKRYTHEVLLRANDAYPIGKVVKVTRVLSM